VPRPVRPPHHRVHVSVVPDLGRLAVFEMTKSELRNICPTTGRLNSVEGPLVGTGDRDVVAAGLMLMSAQSWSVGAENAELRLDPEFLKKVSSGCLNCWRCRVQVLQ
jgi:hypothetical protein